MSRRVDGPSLALAYLEVKSLLIESGYEYEIAWQESLSVSKISERQFLQETAWVILCSGMREATIRRLFPRISTAFRSWESALSILARQDDCTRAAFQVFAHKGKIDAIVSASEFVMRVGIGEIRSELQSGNLDLLQSIPFIGPTTSLHLAKNLGLPLAKPDRHLNRLTEYLGFGSPNELCSKVAHCAGDSVAVVDLVFWRCSTLYPFDQLVELFHRGSRPCRSNAHPTRRPRRSTL